MVLAVSLVSNPARAQSWWSSLDVDAYGNIAGASVTEVPYYYPDFGYDAYAEGLLNDPNGAEVVDVTAFDNGEGYAEADTFAFALVTGDYGQYGNHDVFTFDEYLYQVLGASQASALWSPTSCISPDGEESAYTGSALPGQGAYEAQFVATLTPSPAYFFAFSSVWEDVTYNGDQCYYPGSPYGPFDISFGGNADWSVDNTGTYGPDTIGISGNLYPANYYQFQIYAGYAPFTSCNLFADTQVMSHSCTGLPYHTNTLIFQITAGQMWVSRDGVWGEVK